MTVMANPPSAKSGAKDLASRMETGQGTNADGSPRSVTWALPEEVPVAIQINSASYAVMMATPADLRDFAAGLLLSEGIVRDVRDLSGVLVMPVEHGVTIDAAIAEDKLVKDRLTARAIEGRTGCGLCGVEDIASALKPLPRLTKRWSPSRTAVVAASRALAAHQPMNRLNRSVHAAAWVSESGEILLVREDVGRHNALDKLIGALALSHADTSKGFVFMTSRCSFELVQKCALAGLGALVTVSAPTALALDLARTSGMYLAALSESGPIVFNA